MHELDLDPGTSTFLSDVKAAYAATPAPPAGPALQELFGQVVAASPSTAHSAPTTPRRPFIFLDIFKTLPSKISAGALGAAIALAGMGAAGALPGSMMLISNDDEVVLEESAPESGDTEEVEEVEAAEVENDEAEDSESDKVEVTDLTQVLVPTSQSEAAKTHAFDEACGNHGKYVSYYAHHGEEPPCATDARAAAAGEGSGDGGDAGAEAKADDEASAKNKGQAKKSESKAQKGNRGRK
ncbi:MAG: hypothetical protein ACR2H3_09215 [Acidimicrobiales bacterium]